MAPLLLLLAFAPAPPALAHWRPVPPETATAWLGKSGATLSIRSVDDPKRPGTARRVLTLTTAAGTLFRLPLRDGGGYAGNNGLNLYHQSQDQFLLVSERDCVEIDPIRPRVHLCQARQACPRHRTYLGRFDWMNGFDPPRGAFRFAFRFLPAYDASEGNGC